MDFNLVRAVKHVYDLADAFNVHLTLVDDVKRDYALATNECPCGCRRAAVFAHVIDDETGYAVVLHELGHTTHPWGCLRLILGAKPPQPGAHPRERHRWMDLKLEEERAAWEWARHYALCWTTAMAQVEQLCYGSYEQAKQRTR
jgi:hypothetical protein